MSARYVCVHGHFYQPPRESPWLEAIEAQPSAWPAHDWNERVSAECYAPNSHARILDREGTIVSIVSNYERMSFNFGPTLLSWMESEQPELYRAILDADAASASRFGGHGSALAQVYNHMILPLADRRDKSTQVAWGVRDFERRFGRAPEGMWLAETAVDVESLEVLAEHGVRYTILAPHQCRRVRPPLGDWIDVSGQRVDPRRPYRARLPSGESIDLFFYDGPISRAVAFERLLDDGYGFAQRLMGAFDGRAEPQLVHIATDGETYGHHHAYGEMALAVALARFDADPSVTLVNYGLALERMPPTWECEIEERTSWSCAHGVERWRSDCGCNTGTGWHQKWRAPVREALDWLRDEMRARWEPAARELLRDPWAARDAYIDVVLDRSDASVRAFLEAHGDGPWEAPRVQRALALLELQRHAMLMYTSCGWFFDEPSGLETVQVLRYAARAIQLAQELFDHDFEPAFRERLATAPSNRDVYRDVDGIYRELVLPARVELDRVGAQFAIASVFDGDAPNWAAHGFEVTSRDHDLIRTGASRLATGRLIVRSRVTHAERDLSYAVLHFGDHNLMGGLRPFEHAASHVGMHGALTYAFERADLGEVVRQIERQFGSERVFTLRSLFFDEQSAILARLLGARTHEVEDTFESLYDELAPLMRFVMSLGQAVPGPFRAAADYTLHARLRRAVGRGTEFSLDEVSRLVDAARDAEVVLDRHVLGVALEESLDACARALEAEPDDLTALRRWRDVAAFAADSVWAFEPGAAQTAAWRLAQRARPRWSKEGTPEAAQRLAVLDELLGYLGIRVA
ncbi:MAG: DUF3536 domain-containing protein [Sandaracinaceae bacterium]